MSVISNSTTKSTNNCVLKVLKEFKNKQQVIHEIQILLISFSRANKTMHLRNGAGRYVFTMVTSCHDIFNAFNYRFEMFCRNEQVMRLIEKYATDISQSIDTKWSEQLITCSTTICKKIKNAKSLSDNTLEMIYRFWRDRLNVFPKKIPGDVLNLVNEFVTGRYNLQLIV